MCTADNRPPPATTDVIPCTAAAAVGREVYVWFYADDAGISGSLFGGRIVAFDPASGEHSIEFPDEPGEPRKQRLDGEFVVWSGRDYAGPGAIVTGRDSRWKTEEEALQAAGRAPAGELAAAAAAAGPAGAGPAAAGPAAAGKPVLAAAAAAAAAAGGQPNEPLSCRDWCKPMFKQLVGGAVPTHYDLQILWAFGSVE